MNRKESLFNIVLYRPEIPPNTGNIARLAVCCNCTLHLIGPLAFSLKDKDLKRAGLDFWHLLDLHVYSDFDSFLEISGNPKRIFLITKFADELYWNHNFMEGDYFIFGSETSGLPDFIHERYSDAGRRLALPMPGESRSINLSNSAAIVIFEGMRQFKVSGYFFYGHNKERLQP